ncbi:MAG TPA: NifU family protein [Acidimicrobiales bacterium]|nr:NifU family protein [Acidimicrobiales bacterium]
MTSSDDTEVIVTDSTEVESDACVERAVVDGMSELSEEVIEGRRHALLDIIEMLRPAVQIDGGDLELVEADYINGIVEVQLQGACGSCAVSSVTLTGGVERILKERLDWVTEVVGGVDEEMDQFESAALGRGAYVPKYY